MQWHYGTVWRDDIQDGPIPTTQPGIEWHQIVTLYVYDLWLKNFDRASEGNVAITRLGNSARNAKIIASDQSDCFGGVNRFALGLDEVKAARAPAEIPVVDSNYSAINMHQLIDLAGGDYLTLCRPAIEDCEKLALLADQAIRLVREGWIDVAGFDPSFVAGFLTERAG